MKAKLLISSLLFVSMHGMCQVPFFHEHYLLKKNEPVHVNAIFQDSKGFVWYGTNRGLFRFDGKTYHRFTESDSLPDNEVTAIAEDSLGRIWTGHGSGDLAFISKKTVTRFKTEEGSAVEPVSDILFDRQGRLWFATLNDGLYYYTDERLYRLDDIEGMPDIFVYDLMEDDAGRIWAGTDGGIAICELADNNKVSIDVIDHEDGLPDNIVKRLAQWVDGTVILGTEDAGVIVFNPRMSGFSSLVRGRWQFGSITDFSVYGNMLWIATSQSGLMLYDHLRDHLNRYNIQTGYSLPDITTLLNDREGNLWAGTRAGVIRTLGSRLEFIEALNPSKDINVLAITTERNGTQWFSTGDGLFKRAIDASGKVSITRQLVNTPYQDYTVISLYTDLTGQIWAGLYGEGLLRINPATGKVKYLNKELRNGNVLQITGRENVIWLATLGGAEKITVSGDLLDIDHVSRENGLSSDFIYQVFVDSRERVWFATDGRGVDVLEAGKFRHYDEGLPSKVVYGFAEDSLQRVWVNVQGNGLYFFENGKFSPLDSKARLRSNDVNVIASDENGNIVAAHELGIDVIHTREKTIRFYGEESGLRDKVPTLNALSRDQYGSIFIGTSHGIVRYNADVAAPQQVPDVFIDQLKIFDNEVNLSGVSSFDHDENSVTINYHGFWFQNPAGLQFQYKMENYDEDWIATANNAVTYSRLPPGDYVFRIKSSDSEDFTQAPEASLSFSIAPPFWTTTPFYLGVVALLTISALSFVKYRERQLIEDNQLLEKKVEERTLEIQRNTEEIQAQNEEITAQAEEIKGINENLEMLVQQRTEELEKKNRALEEYAFINAHKLRSPLASILGLINLISKTRLDDEGREICKHLNQSAEELDDIIRSITKAIERGEK